jgi:SET domain-containing protein
MSPDISMCDNKKCTLKEQCYRFTAFPNEYRQTYATFKQINGDCEHFWNNEHEVDNKKRLKNERNIT